MALIVPMTTDLKHTVLNFFLENTTILHIEHYFHTHSPLDNLEHYMWEELNEVEHASLKTQYNKNRALTLQMVEEWISQEIKQHSLE